MNHLYRRSVLTFGLEANALGFALLTDTAYHGGGFTGFVVGALFVALGTARLYLLRKH